MTNSLLHSPADIVRYLLIGKGVGADPTTANPTWPVYASSEPDSPDACVTVYDTTNLNHGRTMPDGEVQEHHGFQVRVRAKDFPTAWVQANLIRQTLQSTYQYGLTLGAESYLVRNFAGIGNPIDLGRYTPTARTLLTINATVALDRTN